MYTLATLYTQVKHLMSIQSLKTDLWTNRVVVEMETKDVIHVSNMS